MEHPAAAQTEHPMAAGLEHPIRMEHPAAARIEHPAAAWSAPVHQRELAAGWGVTDTALFLRCRPGAQGVSLLGHLGTTACRRAHAD